MILNIRTAILLPLFVALAITVLSCYKIELSHYVNKEFSNGRKLRKLKKLLKIPVKKERKFVVDHKQKISTAWITFGFIFAVFLGFAFFEKQGKQSADKVRESIKNDSYEIIRVGTEGSRKKLAYLYCGSRNCAGYDKEQQEVVYFQQSGHSYIRIDSL